MGVALEPSKRNETETSGSTTGRRRARLPGSRATTSRSTGRSRWPRSYAAPSRCTPAPGCPRCCRSARPWSATGRSAPTTPATSSSSPGSRWSSCRRSPAAELTGATAADTSARARRRRARRACWPRCRRTTRCGPGAVAPWVSSTRPRPRRRTPSSRATSCAARAASRVAETGARIAALQRNSARAWVAVSRREADPDAEVADPATPSSTACPSVGASSATAEQRGVDDQCDARVRDVVGVRRWPSAPHALTPRECPMLPAIRLRLREQRSLGRRRRGGARPRASASTAS